MKLLFVSRLNSKLLETKLIRSSTPKSLLPNILAEIIRTFFTSNRSSTEDLSANINKENTLKYDTQFAHTFYDYKIKRFLTDVALGMTPSKVWTGVYDATGGYLIVKYSNFVNLYPAIILGIAFLNRIEIFYSYLAHFLVLRYCKNTNLFQQNVDANFKKFKQNELDLTPLQKNVMTFQFFQPFSDLVFCVQ